MMKYPSQSQTAAVYNYQIRILAMLTFSQLHPSSHHLNLLFASQVKRISFIRQTKRWIPQQQLKESDLDIQAQMYFATT